MIPLKYIRVRQNCLIQGLQRLRKMIPLQKQSGLADTNIRTERIPLNGLRIITDCHVRLSLFLMKQANTVIQLGIIITVCYRFIIILKSKGHIPLQQGNAPQMEIRQTRCAVYLQRLLKLRLRLVKSVKICIGNPF